ncbi:MAG: phosphoribosylanthranilate isomerase [Clostridia bacterium]
MPKVKICGLKRLEDIQMVNKLMPDYIGFIFTKSKRQVDLNTAFKLKEALNEKILAVGVFVNQEIDEVLEISTVIDLIQLHGDENEEYIENLKKLTKKPIIKAISVNSIDDILKNSDTKADFLLFDNGKGGTGQTFDWEILNKLENFQKPYFFAGGLNENNVKNALKYQPFALDVSGGVETDGFKDFNKIKKFIEIVRG